jgi:HTH-type transcriptional regulator, quorum sensing regulator NprR
MEIGNRIRFYRIQKNMTQEELAKGIISVSYLSKIENNQTSASIEVLEMLCDRLGIKLIEEEEIPLLKKLKDWYFLIIQRNKGEAQREYELLKERVYDTNDTKALVYFVLFELRFFLLMYNLGLAKNQIEKIEQFRDIFDNEMNYYYHKFHGLYLYLNNYNAASDHFKIAERILHNTIHFEKLEEADLFYSMGLTYSQILKVALSINYTEKALMIYQALYDLKRSAEWHVILGISYRRIEEFQKAEESLLLAYKIAKSLNDPYLKGIIHHNLGDLYEIQGESVKALEEYKNSMKYKDERELVSKLRSIHSIVSEYYKLGDVENCQKWIEFGTSLIQDTSQYFEYVLHFNIYDYLLNNQSNELEDYLKNVVLPYFEKIDKTSYYMKYAELLADYYKNNGKYKNASYYYSIALQASKKTKLYILIFIFRGKCNNEKTSCFGVIRRIGDWRLIV